jgi:hypothetical protein
VVRFTSVPRLRAVPAAAAGEGYVLAGQILYHLEQRSVVGILGDGCSGGHKGDFSDSVGLL